MKSLNQNIILGIQDGHDSSAALMIDGEIIAAAQEERFTGIKGDYGYPENVIKYLLKQAGIEPRDISRVFIATHKWNPVDVKIKKNANFSVSDWVKEQHVFWKPKLLENKNPSYYHAFKNQKSFVYDSIYPFDHLLEGYADKDEMIAATTVRIETVAKRLGIDKKLITTLTHEDCHNYYAYLGAPSRENTLGITAEGMGDHSNQTIFENSTTDIKLLETSQECHLGHIYRYITLLLGMKPNQHEYKVMGLAPYSNEFELRKSYSIFKDILTVKGLKVVYNKKPSDLYFYFREKLEGHRFDGIAGAVQFFLESILIKLVKNAINKTNLRKIVFSGGVSQNIKANMAIHNLDEVEDIYVCPASGDASLSMGACYKGMWEYCKINNLEIDQIKPIENIYLGPEFCEDEIQSFIKKEINSSEFLVSKNSNPEKIASLLAKGNILGRCCGRMEFGLRALGNRSILADPSNPNSSLKINRAIKFRDFWMPFTPTILKERVDDYIVNPKGIKSPFMTMAFNATELAKKELVSAIHPADYTVRPQILSREQNEDYYALIKAFEDITGVAAILNTSFNLHGDPIVLGPKEAIYTLKRSNLDGLILGDFLILRRYLKK